MDLFLSSQDLQSFEIALVEGKQILQDVHLETSPELFLSTLDTQIRDWALSLDQLRGVMVVTGPGSFTSSRLSVTMANAIAFRFQIPVIPIENPDHLSLVLLLEQLDTDNSLKEFANPSYDRPPHIT